MATAAGFIGGLYGIGGGSLLAPALVGAGHSVAVVAPAALLSTFVTSLVGATTYALLAVTGQPHTAPYWLVGLACGLGGMVGGVTGVALQGRVPQRALRRLLGVVAVALGIAYVAAGLGG